MTYASEVLADNPRVWWRMNFVSGSSFDLVNSGSWSYAAVLGTLGYTGVANLSPDTEYQALSLNGANLIKGADASGVWNAAQWTAEIWFKANNFTNNPVLMANDFDGATDRLRWRVFLTTAGVLKCVMRDSTTAVFEAVCSGPALSVDTAYHLVVTHDGTTLRFYVNGALYGDPVTTPTLNVPPTSRLEVGACYGAYDSSNFNGTVDEFAYYETALSPTRVAAHHSPPVEDITAPNPPENVALDAVTANSVTVSWDHPTTGSVPTTYETSVDDPEPIVDAGYVDATSYYNLATGYDHVFRVRAKNSAGRSSIVEVPFTTPGTQAPTDLLASGVTDTEMTISWTPPVNGPAPTHYLVQVDDQSWVDVGLVTDYRITGLTPNQEYRIRVRSGSSDGFSWHIETYVSTTVGTPGSPTNVTASDITNSGAKLSWSAPVSGPAPVRYEYSLDYGAAVDVGTLMEVVLTGLQNGSNHHFRVRSVGEFFSSEWSEVQFDTVGAPGAPVNLTGSATATTLTASWSAFSGGAATLSYEYSLDSASPVAITNSTVSLTGLTPNRTYTFRVRAVGAYGTSDWTTIQMSTLIGAPGVPLGVSLTDVNSESARIEWLSPNSGGAPQYYEYSLDQAAPVNIGLVTGVSLTGFLPDSPHSIRVRAGNAEGVSAWVTLNFTTQPGAPVAPINLVATGITQTEAFLSWQPATTGAAVVEYEYSLDYSAVASSGTVKQLSLENLEVGSTHNIRVRSVGLYGVSDWTSLTFSTLPSDVPPDTSSRKLSWDVDGLREFEAGLDRGVLYMSDNTGVAWSGLTSLEEDLGDETTEPFYFDGVKFLDLHVMGDYRASVRALMYPDEFLEYEGFDAIGTGMYADDQNVPTFGLSYRTLVGNDTLGTDMGYKIHLVYNLTAVPENKTHASLTDAPNASEFGWTVSAVPEHLSGYRPTAHVILDSRYLHRLILRDIENILYGSDVAAARLPSIQELIDFIDDYEFIKIVDNGDGTWTATGSDEMIKMLDLTTFQITDIEVQYLDSATYEIDTTE